MDGFSLTGACTVLAILLLRALLFRRMPKRVFVLLWAGALGILLFPGLISSPLSVYRLLPRMEAAAAAAGSAASAAVPTAGKLWPVLRQAVTAAGLLGLGVFYLLGLLRLYQSSPARTPAVSDWLAAHPLLRPLQVRTGPVAAPLCGGILLPRIVLPEDMDLTDRAGLDCVLTHEYVHVCRFDPLLKLLAAASLRLDRLSDVGPRYGIRLRRGGAGLRHPAEAVRRGSAPGRPAPGGAPARRGQAQRRTDRAPGGAGDRAPAPRPLRLGLRPARESEPAALLRNRA